MATGKGWTRDELLLVLHLYERIPFGRQHKTNPEDRYASAFGMPSSLKYL